MPRLDVLDLTTQVEKYHQDDEARDPASTYKDTQLPQVFVRPYAYPDHLHPARLPENYEALPECCESGH